MLTDRAVTLSSCLVTVITSVSANIMQTGSREGTVLGTSQGDSPTWSATTALHNHLPNSPWLQPITWLVTVFTLHSNHLMYEQKLIEGTVRVEEWPKICT